MWVERRGNHLWAAAGRSGPVEQCLFSISTSIDQLQQKHVRLINTAISAVPLTYRTTSKNSFRNIFLAIWIVAHHRQMLFYRFVCDPVHKIKQNVSNERHTCNIFSFLGADLKDSNSTCRVGTWVRFESDTCFCLCHSDSGLLYIRSSGNLFSFSLSQSIQLMQ